MAPRRTGFFREVGWAWLIGALAAACGTVAPNMTTRPSTTLSDYLNQSSAKAGIIKPSSGQLRHPYIVPAGPYFQLFDWDTYFMGVALSYDGVGEPLASSIENFLEFVGRNANDPGYAPREIAPDGPWALPEMCKPFLAQLAVRASRTQGSYAWVKPWFRRLQDMLVFWETSRRAPDGLFVWYNGVESGVDNHPGVSNAPALATEGVDLQVYIYREYRALAVLAHELGDETTAEGYLTKAADLRELVNLRMWFEQAGLYLNLDARTGKPIRVRSWTSFTPLWAQLATPARARRMIEEHLLSPAEFWSPYGVRSLAKSEPLYQPRDGYWRGPVWVVVNYLAMRGLLNYGYREPARQLAERTERLLLSDIRRSGAMNECYDPETGAPAANAGFVSWNLLAEHMAEEARTGADPTDLGVPAK